MQTAKVSCNCGVPDLDQYPQLIVFNEVTSADNREHPSYIHINDSMMCQDSVVAQYYSKQMVSLVEALRIGAKSPPQWLKVFEGHADDVCSVNFSPDVKHIVSGSRDYTVRIWDTPTGTLVAGLFDDLKAGVTSVAFSPNGRLVVSASDEILRVRDLPSKDTMPRTFEGHTSDV